MKEMCHERYGFAVLFACKIEVGKWVQLYCSTGAENSISCLIVCFKQRSACFSRHRCCLVGSLVNLANLEVA